MLVYRRHFLGAVSAAAMFAAAPALADTRFVNFAFPATGTPTSRTMPDRLAEVKNVKDFGALGNGSTDDRAAIQAAVDWTSGADRGTVYFPPGSYIIGSPGITINYDGPLTIAFKGSGSTLIGGVAAAGFNGYLISRTLVSPNNYDTKIIFESLIFQNAGAANGNCVRVGSAIGTAFRDCQFKGYIGINTEDSVGISSQNILVSGCKFFLASGNTVSGSRGIISGAGGVIEGSGIKGIDVGFRLYGSGWCANGNRLERCNTAIELGVDSGGSDVGFTGGVVRDNTFEGNYTAIDTVGTVSGSSIENCTGIAHDASNSGVTPGIQGGQYGYRFRADKILAISVVGCSPSGAFDIGAFWMEDQTNRPFATFLNNSPSVSGAAGEIFHVGTKAQNLCLINNAPTPPIWTFAALPSGANVREGDRYDISDANTATWGANVTAGGSTNRCNVRYNGSNWTVVAI